MLPSDNVGVPVRVALLALPQTTPASLHGLHELLSAAGFAWSEVTGEQTETRRMVVQIVAADTALFASPTGPPIAPDISIDDMETADIVIVTDLALGHDFQPRGRWSAEAEWARARFSEGAVLCSICTGSIFLAEAGLLDGAEATSHWGAARFFTEHYPGVALRPERILCPSGPEHRIITGGGAGAWTDLALYLIARFCGQAEAVRVSKVFVLGDRSDGQLPFAAMSRSSKHEDGVIARCQEWLASHYMESSAVARMATLSGLPPRSFKRRFKAATGYAPIDYVQALRIEEAKQLLETTDEATDSVAHMIGYDDPAFFRRLFKRMTGVTPTRYRKRFAFTALKRP